MYSDFVFGDPKIFLKKYFSITTGSKAMNPIAEVYSFDKNQIKSTGITFSEN